ncbi:hypothetical protein MEX01_51520 [Methylorubrum extorquens]|uniref:hypothetical protein n=1 Tax=Methylorubrum extorquens TaxID=408 RepID=UPI00116F6E51|nr:hypothetical protein [Methylorubrum extorquens]GEL44561.1 hypothetical protein MEX01_51520 [Methylorubrum extorquens]
MTSRVTDMRLRKLEQKASQSALSHLTEEQLTAQIVEYLTVAAEPYSGDVRAMIEDMRAGTDPLDHDLAGQIEHLMNNWQEMSLPPLQ